MTNSGIIIMSQKLFEAAPRPATRPLVDDGPTGRASNGGPSTRSTIDTPIETKVDAPGGDTPGGIPGDSNRTTKFALSPSPKPVRRSAARQLIVLLAVSALLVTAGLLWRYEIPRTVTTWTIDRANVEITRRGPGTLDATRRVTIASRVQGRVEKLLAERNDTVSGGAVLAELASEDLAGQLRAAEMSLEASRRSIDVARQDHKRALAARANAHATLQRQKALQTKGWATQSSLDNAQAAFDQAEADVNRAFASISRAEAEKRLAKANVEVARVQFEQTRIRTPISGVVTARTRNVGDAVAPNTTIMDVAAPDSIVLTARFDESTIAEFKLGQKAYISFVSKPTDRIPGSILRIGRQVDTETREFTVDVALDRLPVNWALGQRGTVEVVTGRVRGALAVPIAALAKRNGRHGVWIEKSGRAWWRPVRPGPANETRVVILEGLDAGDRVLRPDGLFPMKRVNAEDADT